MADRRRSADRRPEEARGLAARLRREARAARPAFSALLHERVCAAVVTAPSAAGPRADGRHFGIAGGLAAAAVATAVLLAGWRRPAAESPAPAEAVAAAELPGIERLPTPGEIGAGVLAEVTTLAAAAVGVPELTDVAAFDPAAFDPAAFAAADDAGR